MYVLLEEISHNFDVDLEAILVSFDEGFENFRNLSLEWDLVVGNNLGAQTLQCGEPCDADSTGRISSQ